MSTVVGPEHRQMEGQVSLRFRYHLLAAKHVDRPAQWVLIAPCTVPGLQPLSVYLSATY